MTSCRTTSLSALAGAVVLFFGLASHALAHCDSLDGPVVAAARAALEKKDVTPVLPWIGPGSEAEVRAAFARTLSVRSLSPEARDLADRFFFETVVRVHRAKEGEPFEGLKPAGTDPGPAVRAADRSIEQGSPDAAIRLVAERSAEEIRRMHGRVVAAKRRAGESVAAGREFTAAYAEYVHFVESLYQASGTAPEAAASTERHHH